MINSRPPLLHSSNAETTYSASSVIRSPWLFTRHVFSLGGDARAVIGRADLKFRKTGIWEVPAVARTDGVVRRKRSAVEEYIAFADWSPEYYTGCHLDALSTFSSLLLYLLCNDAVCLSEGFRSPAICADIVAPSTRIWGIAEKVSGHVVGLDYSSL